MKKEAKWQTVLSGYMRELRLKEHFYCYYELKQTEKDHLPFSKIEIHQYDGLQATEAEGMSWKWSDDDMRQKPCDGANLPPLPSYLVVKFIDGFYFVRIEQIVKLREEGHLGITRQYAESVAEKIIRTISNKNDGPKEDSGA